MSFAGSLEKMTITAYDSGDFKRPTGEHTVMINPEKYTRTYKICYNDVQAQGSNTGSPKFNKIPSERIQLELVFDGTGVVPSAVPGVLPYTGDGIAKQIADFEEVVFEYAGKIHSPRFLRLLWGTFEFYCRLTSLTVTYTLFKPDGTPLRARAAAEFLQYTSETAAALEANNSSPDLSHVITVKAGDTLPLLCYSVYGSSAWYPQVARANGLAGFRALAVGSQLLFPPLAEVPA
jgi:contractile injection system tube protein